VALTDRIRIARRFLRSIRIDTDICDARVLEGFVCPQSSAEILLTMARHVSESRQGAFTWTGPYGGGKSSLAVAFSALLGGDSVARKRATEIFGRNLAASLQKSLPPGRRGWRVVPVVGRRENPVSVIGDALVANGIVPRRPRDWTESKLLETIATIAAPSRAGHGGLILFIDEMGKFLEAAAQEGADIYVFQQLAEAAARSGGRLLIIGILHQAFEEYAHRLSHEIRDEWAKIQGRFVDLAVNVSGDEQIDLIFRAIENDYRPKVPGVIAKSVAALVRRDRPEETGSFALLLERCWPLHPAVACLLGPMSRGRFGQNQRSIFGFLNSSEPHGFQDFLRRAGDDGLFDPAQLWDYLRSNLEPSILASPDGHRWALAVEALERCEAIGGDALHVKLLKTIAVIDLFKERSGLVATLALLQACLPEVTDASLKKALAQLDTWSFTIFKKFLDAHAIYAGSDFNIDQAVKEALEAVDEIDFAAIKTLAGLQPVLAKRHYHDTGALRWFDVTLAPLSDLVEISAHYEPVTGTIGAFLLGIPTNGESEGVADELCREAARQSDRWDIVTGTAKRTWAIVTLARELLALESVRNDRPELAGDAVARREVAARLAVLQGQLETELHKAFDSAVWFRKHHKPKQHRYAELNILASELADRRFNLCPKLHNELLNRQRPSSNAIAAQNTLLRRMALYEGRPRLGIEGFPAEGGLLASVLEATGLYADRPDGWRFASPQGNDPCRLRPLWEAATAHVEAEAHRPIAIAELYDLWREQPFGVKDGLMPVLAVSFILSCRDRMAIYREGVFRARFDDVDVDYLAKDPATIQVRWMDLSDLSRRLLSEMATVVRALDERNPLIHLEPIDVARGLVAVYEKLPAWTKRTMQLSANAVRVRDLFKRARDPNRFLFDDIPDLTGRGGALTNEIELHRAVTGLREGLEELAQAYPSMLHRLRDLMLAELRVPNLSSPSLAELRDRAENIRQLVGDFHIEAFVGRLAHFDNAEETFEGIASLAANKPPRPDLDAAAIDIADMAQKFLRAETYTRVKGRPEKRQALAVFIGMNGRPTPILEEFDIADSDREAVNVLIERVAAALDEADTTKRSVILAALAELSARYMTGATEKRNGKGRAAL